MSSQRQIEANRRNAQKSTGPTSATGKAVSSMNALKTGIHAKSLVLPSEKLADLEQLIDEYYTSHNPITPAARALVDDLIYGEWLKRRLRVPKPKSGPTTTRKTIVPTRSTPSAKPPPAAAKPSPSSSGASSAPAAPLVRPFKTSSNSRQQPNRPSNQPRRHP